MLIIKILIILLFIKFPVFAQIQVILKASKNQNSLIHERKLLLNTLPHEFPQNKIKIVRSTHPVWKWRLAIVGIKNEYRAKRLLESFQRRYRDAYINRTKSSIQNHKTLKYKKRAKDEEIEIKVNNLSIKDFINTVSRISGKNILMTEDIEGEVNFIGDNPIKESNLFALLNQVLSSKGYILIDSNNGYLSVIKNKEALKNAPPIFNKSNNSQEIQTAVLKLENMKAVDIIKQAKILVSQYGKVSIANNVNSLIVTDFPQNINAIKGIIAEIDKSNSKTIRFVGFKNVDVAILYPRISKIVSSYFSQGSKSQQIKIVKNENANGIVLVGEKKNLSKIVPYIKKLDMKSDENGKDIELVYIKNTDAGELAKLLNQIISNKSFQGNIINMSENVSKSALKNKKNGDKEFILNSNKPTINYDKQLNAIMIFGTTQERKVLKSLAKKLDVERQQVYVQAKIIEINNLKASKIGMKYGIIGGVSNSSGLYALSSQIGLENSDIGLSLSKSLGLTLPNVQNLLALGATVSLLSEKSAANILSEPSILCINNEESSLYVGQTISVVSQSSIGESTTDLSKNTYSREDIGLTLKIKPRISADNKVALGIEISLEDILPDSLIGLPKTTKRLVKTSAIVQNGETIIVGGLVKDKNNDNSGGIPIIKNIPLLGKLFEYDNTSKEKTTLVLMLTPYIIKNSVELTKLREDLGHLDLLENRFLHSKYMNRR